MNVLDWLLAGDDVLKRLTKRHLLEEDCAREDVGFIRRYLETFDHKRGLFGGGLYGPKWISTTYTVLELVDMEADPHSVVFQKAVESLRSRLWPGRLEDGVYHIDMCIAGMLLKVLCYAEVKTETVAEIIDYILAFTMDDGGWNCRLEGGVIPRCSSVHTTINVLEGLLAYAESPWTHKKSACLQALEDGANVLLDRHLHLRKGTDDPIHPAMTKAHYPPRWKYDYLRALEWFAKKGHPHDDRMNPALDLLRRQIRHGRMLRGTSIPGKRRFPLETERNGRFNTLRALNVLKTYDRDTYESTLRIQLR